MEKKCDGVSAPVSASGRTGWGFVLLIAAVAVVIFWFSDNVVWLGDDIGYQFCIEDGCWTLDIDNPARVSTVGDLFASQAEHYMCCNGRFVAHTLVQLFCGILGHAWFALFNAVMWILFLWTILRSAGGSLMDWKQLLTALTVLVLSFTSLMSPTVQVGYVWMGALVLSFVWLFLSRRRFAGWMLPQLFLFGVVAGNGQDAYNVGVGAALIIYWFRNLRTLTPGQWAMIVGFGIGALLLCLSPGTLSRATEYGGSLGESLMVAALSLRAFCLLAIVVLWKRWRGGMKWRAIYAAAPFYWNALAVCILFNILLSVKSNRQLFGVELMSIVVMLRLLRGHSFSRVWIAVFSAVVLVFWWMQAQRIVIQQRQFARIETCYAASADGAVYVDTWNSNLMSMVDYSYELWGKNEDSYGARCLRLYFSDRYPGRPPLRVYPAMMEGLDTVDVGNRVMRFPYKPGKMIVFQSKESPARFVVGRKMFNLFPVGGKEVDFSEPLKETDKWRAVIVDQLAPLLYNAEVTVWTE